MTKMFKRLLAMVLAVLMALSMAACGGDSKAPAQETKTPPAASDAPAPSGEKQKIVIWNNNTNENQLKALEAQMNDIAAELGARKGGRLLVGFALETHDEQAHAEAKLTKKNFDFIVLNSLRDPGAGFRGDTNKVTLIDRAGREELPLLSKREVAARIVDKIETILK